AAGGDTAVERARSVRIAGRNAWRTALAVVDSVVGWRSFGFKDARFLAGGKRLLLFELGDLCSVRRRLRGFGLRKFDVEALGGIEGLALGWVDRWGHGKSGAGQDEINLYAGIATTDAAPGVAGTLYPHTDEHEGAESEMEKHGIVEEAFEGEVVVGVGGDRHGVGEFPVSSPNGSRISAIGAGTARLAAAREEKRSPAVPPRRAHPSRKRRGKDAAPSGPRGLWRSNECKSRTGVYSKDESLSIAVGDGLGDDADV